MPTDVYLEGGMVYAGQGYYILWVDGEKYNDFLCSPPLTFSEQIDVQTLYREALTDWPL